MRGIFVVLVTVSLAAGAFTLGTGSIVEVRNQNLPLYPDLPASFWTGLAALIGGTLVWWSLQKAAPPHFWLLALWTAYIFVIPELLEIGLRGLDMHIGDIPHLRARTGADVWLYADFPGFLIQFATVQDVLGLDHVSLVKLASGILHFSRALMGAFLGWKLCGERRGALLFSLILLGFAWLPLRFDPTPQNVGFTLFLFLLYLMHGPRRKFRTVLVLVVYLAMTIVHPLAAFASLLIILFTYFINHSYMPMGPVRGRKTGGLLFPEGLMVGVSCSTLFIMWFLYKANFSFEVAVRGVQTLIHEPLRTAQFYATRSEMRDFVFRLAVLFYLVVFSWVSISFLGGGAWRRPDSTRTTYLAYLAPLTLLLATGFYGLESIDRIQLFAAPFVAAFLATDERQGRTSISFLVLLLMLAFTNRYSQEYNQFIPQHEITGARFVVERIPKGEVVFIGKRWSPSFGQVIGRPVDQPLQIDYSDLRRYRPEEEPHYVTYAPRWENLVVFYSGRDAWYEVRQKVYIPMKDTVYTNGKFELYRF